MDASSNAYLIFPVLVFIGVIAGLVWMREKTPKGTVLIIAVFMLVCSLLIDPKNSRDRNLMVGLLRLLGLAGMIIGSLDFFRQREDEGQDEPATAGVATNRKCPSCNLINSLTDVACKRCEALLPHSTLHQVAYGEQDDMPLWVKVGIWGLGNRMSVLTFMWLSIVISVGLAAMRFWQGLFILLAAAWYWGTVRWMDQRQKW